MKPIVGILLANLGTPKSSRKRDVFTYLNEFLTDPRVLELPWIQRQLLVRGIITPSRCHFSTKAYQSIWTKEGSPLLVHGKNVQNALQSTLGDNYIVELGMRYQNPSIAQALINLKKFNLSQLIILPLFPQYASATTGSVHQKVMQHLQNWTVFPKITFINQYANNPHLINAFCTVAKPHLKKNFDHLIFSFHGLPEQQIKNSDLNGDCLTSSCCIQPNSYHRCFKAQCIATAKGIAKELNLNEEFYSISFQSRLGKDPWLQPYTSQHLLDLIKKGKKNVLVMCPAFICDCLETTFEIGIEYAQEFAKAGGNKLDLIEGLNDHPIWIESLKKIILEHSLQEASL